MNPSEIPQHELDAELPLDEVNFSHVEQDVEDEPYTPNLMRSFAAVKVAPADTEDAAAFLHVEDREGDDSWYRRCLSLQRQARSLPAVYPTALSASQAVPKNERVLNVKDLRRGMVAFSYDPRIPGTAGHIYFINGWEGKRLLTTTNDAEGPGLVSVVDFNFYADRWGQRFQFGATNLNGYDFSDFNKPAEPMYQGSLGDQYRAMLEDLIKIEQRKRAKGYIRLADALQRDINRMKRKLEKWG